MKVIIFAQLGSPDSPKRGHVRRYLKAFLSHRLVVDINPILWKIILYSIILPFRSKKSAARYQKIWNGKKFLMAIHSDNFVQRMQHYGVVCELGYLFGQPHLKDLLKKYEKEDLEVWPLFPQYCKSTSGLIEEACVGHKVIGSFHDRKFYIESCASHIKTQFQEDSFDALIISFHSVPLKNSNDYIAQCLESFQLISARLEFNNIFLAFQSKFGRGQWMGPLLEDVILEQVGVGKKKIAVFCAGFLMDCLETELEVGVELKEKAKTWGADLRYIHCLNDQDSWCQAFAAEF